MNYIIKRVKVFILYSDDENLSYIDQDDVVDLFWPL